VTGQQPSGLEEALLGVEGVVGTHGQDLAPKRHGIFWVSTSCEAEEHSLGLPWGPLDCHQEDPPEILIY